MANLFTPGDLVVSVYGRGAPGDTTTYGDNQATPITLADLSITGTAGATLVLPQTASGNNKVISGEYGSSSEGSLELSADGQSLTIAGYGVNAAAYNAAEAAGGTNPYGNAALAQTTSLSNSTTATPVARVIADVRGDGTVDTSTALFNVFNTNNPRSVATVNGTSFYVAGQGVKGDTTQGVFLAQDSASAATAINNGTDARTVEISNNRVYVSQDSKQPAKTGTSNISSFATAQPTGASAETPLPGISQSVTLKAGSGNSINNSTGTVNISPENYFFANANTLYVADSGNPKQGGNGDGGLQKWSLVSGTWTLDYTLSAGLNLVANPTVNAANTAGTTGLIGLTGAVVGNNVELFATNSTIGDTDQTYVYGITDQLNAMTNPGNESFQTLYTAAPDTNVRGIAFAPNTFTATPTIVSDTPSPATGDLGAGRTVTFTLAGSEALFVTGAPTLALSDGGTAALVGGSGTTALTFSTTVAPGQNAASLTVTGVNLPNGATIQNSVGAAFNLSGAVTSTGPQVDTTAPAYGQGSAAPAAGADLGAGKVVTFTVPVSEPVTVTEASGGAPTLRLNDGQAATYTGAVGTSVTSLTYSYTVGAGDNVADLVAGVAGALPAGTTIRDGAGNDLDPSTFKAIDTGVQVDTTPPTASSPTVIAAQGGGAVPIGIAAPADNLTPAGGLAVTAGALPTDGTVTLANGAPVAAGQALTPAQLAGLLFTPTGTAGQGSAFTYSVADGAGNAARGTATLLVGASNAPAPTPGPAPSPAPVDAVYLSDQGSYGAGAFTLSGYAFSTAGVRSVEITAQVDGVATDLGAATVGPNGAFTFTDAVGAHTQGFITATETDGAGGTFAGSAAFSLTAGRAGPSPAEQDRYTADGSALTATDLFRADGGQRATALAGAQTFTSSSFDTFLNGGAPATAFVFTQNHGLDKIDGFRVDGTDHDSLSFTGSDFGNSVAAVLQNTYQVDRNGTVIGHAGDPVAQALNGITRGAGVIVYDPTTSDTVKIADVTKAQLAANSGDIAFHA